MNKYITIPVKYRSEDTFEVERKIKTLKKEEEDLGISHKKAIKELHEKFATTAIFKNYNLNIGYIIAYHSDLNEETLVELVNGPLITSLSVQELEALIFSAEIGDCKHSNIYGFNDLKVENEGISNNQ